MSRISETDLYLPVKAWLEGMGYGVKSEVAGADVVALRDDSDPLVVELKAGFSLTLLQQAVARQAISDHVYVAVPRWSGRSGWRAFKGNIGLCRRLGLGVLSVRLTDGFVQLHCDPAPFLPRKSKVKSARLLGEFVRRDGDPNMGGTNGKIVTAYRQDAEKLAAHLAEHGPMKGVDLAKATGVEKATTMMAANHYGWFERVERGVYGLSDAGRMTLRDG
ncbi:hypothetical protein SAMN04488527_101337 [Aliiroseovarius crassostreae]|uniref:Uncharacterized protein n=1 Tax=Aliiroseovarius crassostreae TaxID=154981 RepID=A0A0P7KPM6_9RHOB|nr:DUF2161 family putative PD-(D/E)XK-type phosphodiesterase [Aliiroseovarius crassostreae]KPN64328.1 hypothetical protein AKJ29_17010 [Aliiroseovarius crassostreae]SFU32547.1 hypothetical protein SAMN04488527_101337 [Aliiroseovarius crassostreae]